MKIKSQMGLIKLVFHLLMWNSSFYYRLLLTLK